MIISVKYKFYKKLTCSTYLFIKTKEPYLVFLFFQKTKKNEGHGQKPLKTGNSNTGCIFQIAKKNEVW